MSGKKNILICPLDWGLGHASRCVPIIKELKQLGHHIIIGADKNPLAFLKQEFPDLQTIKIPGYEVTYDGKGSFLKLVLEGVKFHKFIKEEHQFLDKIIAEHTIDVVISDNRYGLWNKKVKSIIITHQLFVKAPIGESIAQKKIHGLIEQFDYCWIPDVEGEPNLSGDLSHLKPIDLPHQFIGPLSRFSNANEQEKIYDALAIVSGPEPQRTIFEKLLLTQFSPSEFNFAIVCGNPLIEQKEIKGNVTKYAHLNSNDLQNLIEKSKVVICRAGYSSIMDMMKLKKQAILIPTPGQTEQEYLAAYHLKRGNFYTQKQNQFDLKKALVEVANYHPIKIEFEQALFQNLDLENQH